MNESVTTSIFTHKVRIRACGLLIISDRILLIKHHGIGEKGFLWNPPGGGVEFGQTLEETLKREFKEETNLDIEVGKLIYINEHIDERFHGIEFFYNVTLSPNLPQHLQMGTDPELAPQDQMIEKLEWISFDELQKMPSETIHNIFNRFRYPDDFSKNTPFLNLGRNP